ncbi:UNVERIFIED_CONTAM: hypothetical protein FKN15_042188 [Acipenser sinensis]
MPAADGDSADEELEDGSAGSDKDGWEDGLSDNSQLYDITASQRGKLYSLKEISDFLERTKATIPHSSGELKVHWTSSDPTTKPVSCFTPRNLRVDVNELLASGEQRPALQVSTLSSRSNWPVGFAVA